MRSKEFRSNSRRNGPTWKIVEQIAGKKRPTGADQYNFRANNIEKKMTYWSWPVKF